MRSFEIRNVLRKARPRGCGEGCHTLIIASIGSSAPADDLRVEMEKAKVARDMGADVVTDHSFFGDIAGLHGALAEQMDTLVSTVGCYELGARFPGHDFAGISADAPLAILEEQARRGMDIITVHASLLRSHLALVAESNRVIPMTSKGGGIVSAYMRSRGEENPYYTGFDRILDVFARYGVTLSLGTSFRPASVCDHWDTLVEAELATMSELVGRAIDRGVNVMVEGIGHASIDEIPLYVRRAKETCHGVAYRVLPMCMDTAMGFDHISGAIGAAVAVAAGADAVTCMSRAEHIGLPTPDELKEAVIATRVAAHAGELVKLRDYEKDLQMSRTRWQHGCKGDWTVAVYPEGALRAIEMHRRTQDQTIQCAMCGAHCGIAGGIASVP